jgi:(p)ppGpp synthase/HD superfamily hydrolase
MDPSTAIHTLARADAFAAGAHSGQTRRSHGQTPYIVHPRGVRSLLESVGVTHTPTLAAALLHDTVEDTPVTPAQLEDEFGVEIARIVAELTDDKSLSREARHAIQAKHAPSMSLPAACVKIADRTYNLRDFNSEKPGTTRPQKIKEYVTYSRALYDGFEQRAIAHILNKDEDARVELEKAYILLLADMKDAVDQLADKYDNV